MTIRTKMFSWLIAIQLIFVMGGGIASAQSGDPLLEYLNEAYIINKALPNIKLQLPAIIVDDPAFFCFPPRDGCAVPGIKPGPGFPTPGGLQVFMAGTGSPDWNPERSKTCVGIIAEGQFFLFGAGEGSFSTLQSMNLPVGSISKVFLTHFHSDHYLDLVSIINDTWIKGRAHHIEIYGPHKWIGDVQKGMEKMTKPDIKIRSGGNIQMDPELAVAIPIEYGYPENNDPVLLWSDANNPSFRISAFRNDHDDVKISVGYRIEYNGRVVVISGDTISEPWDTTDSDDDAQIASVRVNAQGADLLLHEATNKEIWNIAADMIEVVNPVAAARMRLAALHHSYPLEVANVAQRANVNFLVLTHLIPSVPRHLDDEFMYDMENNMSMGDIFAADRTVLAIDGTEFYLPPGSNQIYMKLDSASAYEEVYPVP
jgi:ribonuclease Z